MYIILRLFYVIYCAIITCVLNKTSHKNSLRPMRYTIIKTEGTRHVVSLQYWKTFEPLRDKTNKMACAPSEDSDQPGHPPTLIRIFAALMKKACVLSYPLSAQRRLWSDWADAQADLSLRWAHSDFVGFVTRRLISSRFKLLCHNADWHAQTFYKARVPCLCCDGKSVNTLIR